MVCLTDLVQKKVERVIKCQNSLNWWDLYNMAYENPL